MIPEEKINEVRKKADIVDIISDYIPIEPKGKNYFALCPFHDDHNPSLSISREKQIFNCFTCHTGGNVFNFVMEYENVSFPEAVKIVGNKVGIDLQYKTSTKSMVSSPLFEVMDLAKKYYLNKINTTKGVEAKKYLNNRGIDNDTISLFEIGLASDEKDSLVTFLNKQNIENNILNDLGLLTINGPEVYDTFRNRIMVPIHNLEGNTVGFGGRTYNNDESAKYINTKETNIFKKGHILFNYHMAKSHVKKYKSIILVEGYFDVIKMSASGIDNVVALMGTAVTNDQIAALKKLRTTIILLLDSDQAGKNASITVGDLLTKNKVSCKVVDLGDEKDPDDYIDKHGVDKLQKLIKDAQDFIDFKLKMLKEKYDINKIEELSEFIQEILTTIENLEPLAKDLALNKISKEYNLDINILKDRLPKETKKITKTIEPTIKKDKYRELANTLLYFLANDKNYARIYKNEVNIFKEKEERELAGEIYLYQKENEEYNFADFLTYIAHNEVLYNRSHEILNENLDKEMSNEIFLKYVEAMKTILKEDDIKKLLEKIKNENDPNKKIDLINKLTELKKEG